MQGPAATVDAVRDLVGAKKSDDIEEAAKADEGKTMGSAVKEAKPDTPEAEQANATIGDATEADVAAEVADSAEKLDGAAHT